MLTKTIVKELADKIYANNKDTGDSTVYTAESDKHFLILFNSPAPDLTYAEEQLPTWSTEFDFMYYFDNNCLIIY